MRKVTAMLMVITIMKMLVFGPLITIDKKMLYGRYFKFIVENEKFKIEDYLEY